MKSTLTSKVVFAAVSVIAAVSVATAYQAHQDNRASATAEQKLAMDAQDRAWQTAAKSKTPAKG